MQKKIVDILCCPTCKGNLSLKVDEEKEDEIIKGNLYCKKCKVNYQINEGIADLLPKT